MEYRYLFVGIYAAWAVVFGRGGGCCLAESPYGWGVSLAGKITFLPAQQGPKPLFLLSAKEKAVLDSEKEKVDQWKFWRGAVQPHKAPTLLGYPSGKRL